MNRQQALFGRFSADLPAGKVEWIGVRPARREPMIRITEAEAIASLGLKGDRRMDGSPGSGRQVTFISAEHIDVVAQLLKYSSIDPARLRRNIVISGVNLNALRHQQFRIGDAIFLATAACHPCSRMDEVLGQGGHAAMLGHGGLCAKILRGGSIKVGDAVVCLLDGERLPEG
ncbi:MAG: MOSC domain-containing protein [Thalassolituus sp.]|jgi:MOSC domain-containing protein YiiM|uniref:MOSC domain-containing protein n=1 Tax=Thalassolituus TaxID=187492 RepID=UPI00042DD4BB|nr:MOSC domain-containing protein [Thalassolituus oleivorans]AHK16005.1 molybdopterin cofactor sulfurase domain containing protein [Thalassolituus oleivorans R6-15]APR67304.1 sulfurase [Thalassolituus oleivorans]MCA6127920.1 sulfurase [Thalassolituus oleivorans 4BN06-13]MDF1639737.1 MOSC domain-containing protein [Thalassolituus oleivorans]